MKVVLVTGSRDWTERVALEAVLNEANPDIVIHGGCRGADTMANTWAHRNNVARWVLSAPWKALGKRAGPIRNVAMVELATAVGPPLAEVEVHAFVLPNSRGTWSCIRVAEQANLRVIVHRGGGE